MCQNQNQAKHEPHKSDQRPAQQKRIKQTLGMFPGPDAQEETENENSCPREGGRRGGPSSFIAQTTLAGSGRLSSSRLFCCVCCVQEVRLHRLDVIGWRGMAEDQLALTKPGGGHVSDAGATTPLRVRPQMACCEGCRTASQCLSLFLDESDPAGPPFLFLPTALPQIPAKAAKEGVSWAHQIGSPGRVHFAVHQQQLSPFLKPRIRHRETGIAPCRHAAPQLVQMRKRRHARALGPCWPNRCSRPGPAAI